MAEKQRTLKAPITFTGKGLHSGVQVTMTLKPAPDSHGYIFKRIDLPDQPMINALAENVVETIAEMQNVVIEQRTVDQLRSISISNCCVSTIDFNIQPDLDDEKYIEMLQAGQQATMQYLENYRLPTDWLAGLKEKMGDLFEMW